MVASQEKLFDGGGCPRDGKKGDEIPIGSRILRIALDYDALIGRGIDHAEAVKQLSLREGWYDPAILESFHQTCVIEVTYIEQRVHLDDLKPYMLLAQEVRDTEGTLLVPKGLETTPLLISRLKNFHKMRNINEHVQALVPETQPLESELAEAGTAKKS